MNSFFSKTFGGLTKAYYLRQLFFGSLFLLGFSLFLGSMKGGPPFAVLFVFLLINTLLYPYARFVYESVVGFILGDNVFVVSGMLMLITKYLTMGMCWAAAIFIAPLGLGYLYFRNSAK